MITGKLIAEAQQLTRISTEASTGIWSPDGKHIAFVSAVYPEYSDKPFKQSDELNKNRVRRVACALLHDPVARLADVRHAWGDELS